MTRRYYANAAPQQTLSTSLNASATSLTIAGSFTGWPSSFPFFATLDLGTGTDEIVSVTGISGTTATIVRGQDGTTAQSHPSGATLDCTVVRQDLDEANAHVNATTGVHGVSGAVVGTTDTQTLTNKTLTNAILNNPTVSGGNYTNFAAAGDATHAAMTGSATTSGGKTFSGKNSSGVEKFSVNDAGNVVTSGTVSSAGITSSGPASATTGSFSGAVTGASFTATGAVAGATANITGAVSAGSVSSTGAVSGSGFTASGNGVVSGVIQPNVYATTAARDAAITSPAAGMTVFITAEGRKHTYNGSAWVGETVMRKYSGTTDSHGFATITHSLGFTPTCITATPCNPVTADANASFYMAAMIDDSAINSTTFKVRAINGATGFFPAGTTISVFCAIS